MQATHEYDLNIQELSATAQHTNLYPDNKSGTLISIGQLCDDGCRAVFAQNECTIEKNNKIILRGPRNSTNGLWDIVLNPVQDTQTNEPQPVQTCNNAYEIGVKQDLITFLHAAAFSPVKSTW